MAGEFSIRSQHLISFIMYIGHLYKKDWANLHLMGCRAVALSSAKQIVTVCQL